MSHVGRGAFFFVGAWLGFYGVNAVWGQLTKPTSPERSFLRNERPEGPARLRGELVVHVAEDEEVPLNYQLQLDSGSIFKLQLPGDLEAAAGSIVEVAGYMRGDSILASCEDLTVMAVAAAPPVVGVRRIAVALADFLDSPARPFTPEMIYELAFNGQPQAYFQNQSYGQLSLSGDVYDWYRFSRNGPSGPACPSWPVFDSQTDLEAIILGSGINLAKYDHLIIFISHPCVERGISTSGQRTLMIGNQSFRISVAVIGEAWQYDEPSTRGAQPFPWTNFDHLFSHELGHGLGLQHAKGYDCGSAPFYQFHPSECFDIEYGNHFDLMARANFTLGLNVYARELLGWIEPAEILDIRTSGRYTINAVNLDSPVKGAKIDLSNVNPPAGTNDFYIEFRPAVNFDANLRRPDLVANTFGLLINQVFRPNSVPHYSRALDVAAGPAAWDDDLRHAALTHGTVLTDAISRISIGPIISARPGSITFDVGIGADQCFRAEPSFGGGRVTDPDSIGTFKAIASESGYLELRLSNNDYFGCGGSNLHLDIDWPSHWYVANQETATTLHEDVLPQVPRTVALPIHVPSKIAAGRHDILALLTNESSGRFALGRFTVVVGSSRPDRMQP